MSVTLRGSTGIVEVHWWWEAPREGQRRMPFKDRAFARAFLGHLGEHPGNLAVLRRFAHERLSTPSFHVDDAALLDAVAWWVADGRVRITGRLPELRVTRTTGEEARAEAVTWDAPAPEAPVAPVAEPSTFGPESDAPAIAAAMREAAREGVPFCEECTRKRLAAAQAPVDPEATLSPDLDAAAQAATLQRAAARGAPFCEECEKAKAARAARVGAT